MTSPAFRALASLALIAVAALPGTAQKSSPTLKKSPPPAAPQAKPATPATPPPATLRSKPLAPGLRGEASTADENEGREADPAFDPRALLSRAKSAPATAASAALHLANHPKRDELAKWLVDNLRGREIDVALLGGEKYMINSCLGIKVSSGTFKLELDNPVVRFENSGIVVSFGIDRVGFSAIKLRMRPNPNVFAIALPGRRARARRPGKRCSPVPKPAGKGGPGSAGIGRGSGSAQESRQGPSC